MLSNRHQQFEDCWHQYQTKWKDQAVWEHAKNSLQSQQYIKNRYYHRGSDPSQVVHTSCCDNYLLEENRNNANRVLSYNNPYAEDFPSQAKYSLFSIFGENQLTIYDFYKAINYYNEIHADNQAEEKFGPFDQHNLNEIAKTAYNVRTWDHSWNRYTEENKYHHAKQINHQNDVPQLKKLIHKGATMFMNAINQSFYHLNVQSNLFHIGKFRLFRLMRSSQTGYLRFEIIVSIVRNTTRDAREFELTFYFDPHTNHITLGKATYIGVSTTDKLLLPKGLDSSLYPSTTPQSSSGYVGGNEKGGASSGSEGRPLHPLHSKESELISLPKAHQMYQNYIIQSRTPPKPYPYPPLYPNEANLPFWFKERHYYS